MDKYISFDLGMLGNYRYYTGIIFKGYTYGTGDCIVTGRTLRQPDGTIR